MPRKKQDVERLPDMTMPSVVQIEKDLIKRLKYVVEVKILGDPANKEGGRVLEQKFERELRGLKVGDGRTFLQVGGVWQVDEELYAKEEEPEIDDEEYDHVIEEPWKAKKAKPVKRSKAMKSEEKKRVQFSTRHDIHEKPEGEFIT